jgi:hypothetical protein
LKKLLDKKKKVKSFFSQSQNFFLQTESRIKKNKCSYLWAERILFLQKIWVMEVKVTDVGRVKRQISNFRISLQIFYEYDFFTS